MKIRDLFRAVFPPILFNPIYAATRMAKLRRRTGDAGRYTVDFFEGHAFAWAPLIEQYQPKSYLEVGSLEGMSASFFIRQAGALSELSVHCIDTWEGGVEHLSGGKMEMAMSSVEARFDHNVSKAISAVPNRVRLVKHRDQSHRALACLINQGLENSFDFAYIDGSHQAPDVLIDAVLSFKLVRTGGILVFDDYLWAEEQGHLTDPLRSPKLAIDSFVNVNIRKLEVFYSRSGQLVVRKTSC